MERIFAPRLSSLAARGLRLQSLGVILLGLRTLAGHVLTSSSDSNLAFSPPGFFMTPQKTLDYVNLISDHSDVSRSPITYPVSSWWTLGDTIRTTA